MFAAPAVWALGAVLLAATAPAAPDPATPSPSTPGPAATPGATGPGTLPPGAAPPAPSSAVPAALRARVEARSSDLLAVGTVLGDRMTVHVTRILDNAPVDNAAVAVMLRGTTHTATAEADGSYSIETPDLDLPGPASIEFLVTLEDRREEMKGTLAASGGEPLEDKGSSRQLGWWVLNFAVCIGFLWLWSRRKSADA